MEAYRETAFWESSALWRLAGFLRARHQAWGPGLPDFECFERELHTHVLAFERELLAAELARSDVDAEPVSAQCNQQLSSKRARPGSRSNCA